jgi:NAD(P)-dependent dehydrogenase (short-subunit alcohol dehydrogenase family)
MRSLEGQVAVVAGATRGAGRGIARALGEANATVYCTGRSVRGSPSSYNRPETIEETAELVTAAGGKGIAVRVDHTVEAEVEALFERIDRDAGRLDVLVTSIAGEDPMFGAWASFWDLDLTNGAAVLKQSLFSHLLTAKHGARRMIAAKRGLIVGVTEGDTLFGGANILNDIVKTGIKGLAMRMAEELRPHSVATVAITPGFLRSESMLQHFGVTEETWRDGGKQDPHFLFSETPLFVGRAVAALAGDPTIMERSGWLTSSWEVAREFGFTDADGTRPDWGRHVGDVVIPEMAWVRESMERYVTYIDRLAARAKADLAAGATAPQRKRTSTARVDNTASTATDRAAPTDHTASESPTSTPP